jgi:hypothetical protein
MLAGFGVMGIAQRLVTDHMRVLGSHELPAFPETPAGIYLREGFELGKTCRIVDAFVAACKPPSPAHSALGWRLRSGSIAQPA